MTLPRKIYLGYALAIVLIVIVSALGIYGMTTTQQGYRVLVTTDVSQERVARQAQFDLRDGAANLRAALLYPDVRAEYIAKAEASLAAAHQAVSGMEGHSGSQAASNLVAQIVKEEDIWHSGEQRVLDMLKNGKVSQAVALGDAQVAGQRDLIDLTTQLIGLNTKNMDAHLAQTEASTSLTNGVILGAALLAIAIAIAAAVLISRSTTGSLRDVILKLVSSAAEMLAVSSQVASSASQTATSISETSATVVEVRQTAQLVNEKAGELAESADETARIAEMGSRAVEETIAGIERMGEQMGIVTDSIVRLSEQTSAISDVITSVNDLAEQSNLLSVNAAIEAAKAGDQGKGFAVVAQEVRNLADQSKQAVLQVRAILSDIEKATAAAVMATELGSKSIESGAKQSLQSGEAIDQLADSVNSAVQAIQQTVASTEQQFAGLDQINSAMDAINEASAQNVSGTRQIEAEVQHLRDMASALEALVDHRTTLSV